MTATIPCTEAKGLEPNEYEILGGNLDRLESTWREIRDKLVGAYQSTALIVKTTVRVDKELVKLREQLTLKMFNDSRARHLVATPFNRTAAGEKAATG